MGCCGGGYNFHNKNGQEKEERASLRTILIVVAVLILIYFLGTRIFNL